MRSSRPLTYGVKVSGCTVHFVDEHLDHGAIVLQRAVPVLDGDDAHTLAERILVEEHTAYPEAISAGSERGVRDPRKAVCAPGKLKARPKNLSMREAHGRALYWLSSGSAPASCLKLMIFIEVSHLPFLAEDNAGIA